MADTDPGAESSDGWQFEWRYLVVVPVAILLALAVAYSLGWVGAPSAGIADRGDWGEVTEQRTEVVTTVWVHNPNPLGASFGRGLDAEYGLALNGVPVGNGSRSGIDVPAGNSTVELRTWVRNDRLDDWWVAFVRANETVRVDFDATVRIDVGPTVGFRFDRTRTRMADSTPVIGTFSAAANRTRGTYTETVDVPGVDERYLDRFNLTRETVTVGYEIERGWATWGDVDRNETTVRFHLRVHNPGDVPVPATPDGVRVAVDANGVRLFESDGEPTELRSLDAGSVLRPGENRTVEFAVSMDNDRIDEWFTSHVRRGERTDVTAQFRLRFANPVTNETIRLPPGEPVTYRCSLRTAILVDGRTGSTACEPPDSFRSDEGARRNATDVRRRYRSSGPAEATSRSVAADAADAVDAADSVDAADAREAGDAGDAGDEGDAGNQAVVPSSSTGGTAPLGGRGSRTR